MRRLLRKLRVGLRSIIYHLAHPFYIHVYANIEMLLFGPTAFRNISATGPVSLKGVRNVAILAVHAPTPDFALVVRSLKRHGYTTIAYAYSADHTMTEEPDVLFVREQRFGRDFLAYKHAAALVAKSGGDVDRILFVNDSFFVKEEIDDVIGWFAESRADWSGYSLNFREHFHVGSYLFQVKGRALSDVQEFMTRYWPRNTRYHSINRGETGLSRHLIERGNVPAVYLIEKGRMGAFCSRFVDDIKTQQTWALELYNKMRLGRTDLFGTYIISSDAAYNLGQIARYMECSNVINQVGYYMYQLGLLDLIKKDILYRSGAYDYFSQVSIPTLPAPLVWRVMRGRSRYMRAISIPRRMKELLDD